MYRLLTLAHFVDCILPICSELFFIFCMRHRNFFMWIKIHIWMSPLGCHHCEKEKDRTNIYRPMIRMFCRCEWCTCTTLHTHAQLHGGTCACKSIHRCTRTLRESEWESLTQADCLPRLISLSIPLRAGYDAYGEFYYIIHFTMLLKSCPFTELGLDTAPVDHKLGPLQRCLASGSFHVHAFVHDSKMHLSWMNILAS